MPTLRSALALVLVLALISSACRSEVAVEPNADNAAAPTIAPEPTSAPPPPTPSEPSVPQGEGDPVDADNAPARFTGRSPNTPSIPEGWDDIVDLDPAVVEGELANGLRYLIRRNLRPGSQAQLRLVVHAGSINEEPGTAGVAHFLEHMMFNGTERFPGNEIVNVLEGFGSSFGPDVNAYTSFEETVYELQVPTRSVESLQLGLEVLYEWSTAATIANDDVVAERGVVREEHRRAVEPLGGRIGQQVRDVLFAGTAYVNREPIGEAAVIEAMTSVELRAFYERWYRPELMTIVAVGDFDPGDMERRIAATFDQPASPTPTEPLVPSSADGPLPEPVYDVIIDAEIQRAEIEVLWRLADSADLSRSAVRDDVIAQTAFSMLNSRLFERVQRGEGGILSANAGSGGFTPTTRIVNMSAQTNAADTADALGELLGVIEQARQFGFSQQELDRELNELRATVEQEAAESETRQDAAFAAELVEYALDRSVLLDANEQRQYGLEVIDSITVEDVQAFLFTVLDSSPYVLLTAPAADEALLPSPEALAQRYDAVVGFEAAPEERATSALAELMARPEPAAIIDEQRLGELDTTVITYANGARLAFRQTAITENVVRMRASSPGGFFAVEGPVVPLLDRATGLVAGSGFTSIDVVALDQFLSGKIASLSTSIGRAAESLTGESSTEDLETMFQLVYLQMTEPTITDLQVRQFRERWQPLAENPAANPSVASDLELWRLRYGDSPYFRLIPTVEDLAALDEQLVLEAYQERFGNAGDFVFSVVGDFDPAVLIDLGARYLGTLPDNGVRETPIDRDPGVPEENLVATVRAGVGDQGRVRINWESPFPFTLEAKVAAQALELVVNARLRDLIREQLGASYSPNAAVTVLSEPKSWVDTIIEVESDPDRLDEVSLVIHEELDRIRAGDLDEQYLLLAIDQLAEGYRFFSNNDWLELLNFHTRYPDRPAGEFRNRRDIVQRLTIEDIASTARVVFPPTRSVEVRLEPAQ